MPTIQEELLRKGLIPKKIEEVKEESKFDGYLDQEVVEDFEKEVHMSTRSLYHPIKTKVPFVRKASKCNFVWEGKMRFDEKSQLYIAAKALTVVKHTTTLDFTELLKVHFPDISRTSTGTILSKMARAGVVRKDLDSSGCKTYSIVDEQLTPEIILVKYAESVKKSKGSGRKKRKEKEHEHAKIVGPTRLTLSEIIDQVKHKGIEMTRRKFEYYQKLGLLPPPMDKVKGIRGGVYGLYSEHVIQLIESIDELQRKGHTLDDILKKFESNVVQDDRKATITEKVVDAVVNKVAEAAGEKLVGKIVVEVIGKVEVVFKFTS